MSHRFSCAVLALAMIVAGAATRADAQGLTGQISGVVTDTGGGVMPGATVTVKNVGTNLTREAVTGPDGAFVITNLLAGTFDLHGELPVNPDGGLKSFGHPVGASGLRMMFEAWLQLRHQAPEERQITTDRSIGLTHNLGGYPGEMVSFIGLVSPELG